MHQYKAKEKKNIVLITDALCYSATDIFAAGFQDHKLGDVLGVHENTGAGGANVWTHWILNMLTSDDRSSPYFQSLPYGADMRVAVRRTLRVGMNAGIPLEDLGVVPQHRHEMTRADLLDGNRDLIDSACRILSGNEN
jgi:C-terminal processing protease CtpA/Prc